MTTSVQENYCFDKKVFVMLRKSEPWDVRKAETHWIDLKVV